MPSISIDVPDALLTKIDKTAKKEERTRAALIRYVLSCYIDGTLQTSSQPQRSIGRPSKSLLNLPLYPGDLYEPRRMLWVKGTFFAGLRILDLLPRFDQAYRTGDYIETLLGLSPDVYVGGGLEAAKQNALAMAKHYKQVYVPWRRECEQLLDTIDGPSTDTVEFNPAWQGDYTFRKE